MIVSSFGNSFVDGSDRTLITHEAAVTCDGMNELFNGMTHQG